MTVETIMTEGEFLISISSYSDAILLGYLNALYRELDSRHPEVENVLIDKALADIYAARETFLEELEIEIEGE